MDNSHENSKQVIKPFLHTLREGKQNGLPHLDGTSKNQLYRTDVLRNFRVQADKQVDRRMRVVEEVLAFVEAEERFKQEQFFNRPFVYLVSNQWIQNWKKSSQYSRIIKKQQPNWQNPSTSTSSSNSKAELEKSRLNRDLVEDKEVSLKLDGLGYLNVVLKSGLMEGRDFCFFSQQMWEVFGGYRRVEVKREIVKNERNQFIVQLRPQKFTILILSNRLLNQQKTLKRQTPPVQTCQYPKHKTFGQFSLALKDPLLRNLALAHSIDLKEDISQNSHLKLLLVDPTFTIQKVRKRIAGSIGCQDGVASFGVAVPGREVDGQGVICREVGGEEVIVVCEIVQPHENSTTRICSTKNSPAIAQCPKCKTLKLLPFPCSCHHIAYCSQPCKTSDFSLHSKKCTSKPQLLPQSHSQSQSQSQSQYKSQIDQPHPNQNANTNKKKPGLVGLRNLGNTCFMNSGVQCLSHVYELTRYFLDGEHIGRINKENSEGTKGNLVNAYCYLIKNLWQENNPVFTPHEFKKSVSSYQRMFSGEHQHDVGQFLTYLLSGLHEDLNPSHNHPYTQQNHPETLPQPILASTQWQAFLSRNKSKIVDLMYGQFRSQVQCTQCKYRSLQFDPFLMCSLPIVEILSVEVCYQNQKEWREEVLRFRYRVGETVAGLAGKIRKRLGLQEDAQLIFYHSRTEIMPNQDISAIKIRYKPISLRILSEHEHPNGTRIQLSLKSHETSPTSTLTQTIKTHSTKLYKFKSTLTYAQVHQALYSLHRPLLDIGDVSGYQEMVRKDVQDRKVKIYVENSTTFVTGECWACHAPPGRCKGCLFPYSQESLGNLAKKKGVVSLKYIITTSIRKSPELIDERNQRNQAGEISLMDCFDAFEEPELLTQGNCWLCPKCKSLKPATKQMWIYKTPEILILCLKRFKKTASSIYKNSSFVKFPLTDLDLTDIIYKPQSQSQPIPQTSTSTQPLPEPVPEPRILYNLFAVSNHHGQADSGHYTAYCKSQNKNSWHRFNDDAVNEIAAGQVVSRDAYLLFYRRK